MVFRSKQQCKRQQCQITPDYIYSSLDPKDFFNHSAILNLTSSSSPLLSPIALPAGPADRFLQMCYTPIGCFLTGLSLWVSYFPFWCRRKHEGLWVERVPSCQGWLSTCQPAGKEKSPQISEIRQKQDLINCWMPRWKCITVAPLIAKPEYIWCYHVILWLWITNKDQMVTLQLIWCEAWKTSTECHHLRL